MYRHYFYVYGIPIAVLCTGIHIGFEFVSYVVSEGEHSADVCAVVKSGTIQNVSIQVDAFAMSETAESM